MGQVGFVEREGGERVLCGEIREREREILVIDLFL